MDMRKVFLRTAALALLATFIAPAQAASYRYKVIDYQAPATTLPNTEFWGISDDGQIAADANGDIGVSLRYGAATGRFTDVSPPGYDITAALGVNESGAIAGYAFRLDSQNPNGFVEYGFIRSRRGAYTFISHPGAVSGTDFRGINEHGVVTGIYDTATDLVGFIYDPARQTFTDLNVGSGTIAHGIDSRGDVVGSTFLAADKACAGCPAGIYGWLRDSRGSVTYFRVNSLDTRARGITESGRIAGFIGSFPNSKAFVTKLRGRSGYQALTIVADDLLVVPGFDTVAEGISDDGVVVGILREPTTSVTHGFTATPISR
ncbi:MAG: hypothetical protein WCE48_10820 [Steroidobacteraceae bacterium]